MCKENAHIPFFLRRMYNSDPELVHALLVVQVLMKPQSIIRVGSVLRHSLGIIRRGDTQ